MKHIYPKELNFVKRNNMTDYTAKYGSIVWVFLSYLGTRV